MKLTTPTSRKATLLAGLLSLCASSSGQTIPTTWDEAALASMQTPLRDPSRTPKQMPSAIYYRIPVVPIYKTYPVYAPGRAPAGYLDRLRQKEPEIISDPTGEAVFDAGNFFGDPDQGPLPLRSFPAADVPVAKDGTYPFVRYVIRTKGKLEVGGNSCATCHTRVLPDGSVVKGAQGNFPADRIIALTLRALTKQNTADAMLGMKPLLHTFFAAPWIKPDPFESVAGLSAEEFAAALSRIPAGVMTRGGSTLGAPPQIPDLIGIRDRLYLNHTGTHLHRTVGDLMRYAALAQGAEVNSSWGDFRLMEEVPRFATRFTDEALYALAQYLYALQPPANPNHMDAQSRAGRAVFEREGCGGCHTAPLYTNNKLTPANGFEVPTNGATVPDLVPVRVGTDPELAMFSRRGTGYYKVPSLKGVWYRGPFGHGGTSPALEDWLDSARLAGGGTRKPSPGHEYGLRLKPRDKKALIAFLRTL